MHDPLADIVADALGQAEELFELDGPRAEVWASDLVSLAGELGDGGAARLVAALEDAGGGAAAAALWAIEAVALEFVLSDAALALAPPWADHLGTSECEAAWTLSARRGESVAFRFVDGDDARHVVVVDLVPRARTMPGTASEEEVGEVTIGPAALLDAIDDPDARIRATDVVQTDAAARVARALRATTAPTPSLVAAGRVLALRLASMGVEGAVVPISAAEEAPAPLERDPEGDAYAREILGRVLGAPEEPDVASLAGAATALRAAAAADEPAAQWLAASRGPIDLDEPDLHVVIAALAATVLPSSLSPLAPDARRAVVELEWADWLGAVVGLVRGGVGTSIDPDDLVDLVNRCPEVTSTIAKGVRPRIAWAFGICTELWDPIGIGRDGALTALGVSLLPRALEAAWAAP